MKNLFKYTAFLLPLALIFSGCLSFLFKSDFNYDAFQDNDVYRDKIVGVWTQDPADGGYQTREFKSDGTGINTIYKNGLVVDTEAFKYKLSDFQIAFYFIQTEHKYRANYVINNNTLSLVNRSDGNTIRPFNKTGVAQRKAGDNEIANALINAANTIIKSLPKEVIIAIVNISSSNAEVSEFIAGELEFILVNNKFIVVDRSQLDKIRQEQNFQLSEEVDDSSVVSIGKFVGANVVMTGAISGSGNMRRFRLRALDTQTARVLGAASEALPDDTGSAQSAAKPSSTNVSYKIGDRGPGGGFIFYDKGALSDGWRYLEAAPVETEFTARWSRSSYRTTPDFKEDIGYGKRNTNEIISYLKRYSDNDGSAAQLCTDIISNGLKDWFLPSIKELELMYKNLKQKGIGSLTNNWYWSSSVDDKGYRVQYMKFNEGRIYSGEATMTLSVRAIRQF